MKTRHSVPKTPTPLHRASLPDIVSLILQSYEMNVLFLLSGRSRPERTATFWVERTGLRKGWERIARSGEAVWRLVEAERLQELPQTLRLSKALADTAET